MKSAAAQRGRQDSPIANAGFGGAACATARTPQRHGIGLTISDASRAPKKTRGRLVTARGLARAAEIAACARARGKIENESFNILKIKRLYREHNSARQTDSLWSPAIVNLWPSHCPQSATASKIYGANAREASARKRFFENIEKKHHRLSRLPSWWS